MNSSRSPETIKFESALCDELLQSTAASEIKLTAQTARQLKSVEDAILAKKAIILDVEQKSLDAESFKKLCSSLGAALGKLVIQNEQRDSLVEVYDRRKGTIKDGVRYHQSHEGGDIHTDSVNHPIAFRYLILGCYQQAEVGGESIVLFSNDVYEKIRSFPEASEQLMKDFWFEGRGMGEEVGLFRMPILSLRDGEPHFRYLRSYIESAHKKAAEPLTASQECALDLLDTALESSELRRYFMLSKMQILLTVDTQVFHGRTRFFETESGPRRMLYRVWVN